MLAGMGAMGGLCLVFGIAPQFLMSTVAPAVRALGFAWYVNFSWLGVQTSSAGAQVTLGAGLALVALLAGYGIYLAARPARVEVVGVFTGGDPLLLADGTLSAEDFSALAGQALEPIYTAVNPDPLFLAAWRGLSNLAHAVDGAVTPTVESSPVLAALAVTLVVAIVALVWQVKP